MSNRIHSDEPLPAGVAEWLDNRPAPAPAPREATLDELLDGLSNADLDFLLSLPVSKS